MISLLGLVTFPALAFLFCEDRGRVSVRFVIKALVAQIVLAVLFLKMPILTAPFAALGQGVQVLQEVTQQAAIYLFGYLAGGEAPFQAAHPEHSFIVVFQVLPLIIVVSALSALLFHWGVIPAVVRALAWLLKRSLGISGSLGLGAAGTVFLGTIEAPLLVRPYLLGMSRSELLALVTCSMSTVSGAVLILYASVLTDVVDNPISHLLVASIMSVPAALMMAHLMIPPESELTAEVATLPQSSYRDGVDALLRGGEEGMRVVISVVTVLLTAFSAVYLVNRGLGALSDGLTLQTLLGYLVRPIIFLTGVPWAESLEAGRLLGTKIVLNEFVAYLELAKTGGQFSDQTRTILTYALCGFANFGSFGIIVGGLSAIMPERQRQIASLTWRSLWSGNLACLQTAAVVGLLHGLRF